MNATQRLRDAYGTAALMEPQHEAGLPPWRRRALRLLSTAIITLLDVNDRAIARFQPPRPAIWDAARWPWIADLADDVPAIRSEVAEYLRDPALPHVAEIAGFDPSSANGREAVPVDAGTWKSAILFANGRWIDETAKHFPTVRRHFEEVHPKANVGFSVLGPHSHIDTHVGVNRGALRLQLPIVVPGAPGDCRIRIGEDMVVWREAEPVVFDLSCDHEAWNDSDDYRVLLMVELALPLRRALVPLNRLSQRCYRWHPSYRGMPERIAQFGRAHDERMRRLGAGAPSPTS